MRRCACCALSSLALGAFLLWLAIPAVLAQETRGQILGRVLDQSGAVVVGATVRAMNTGTNVETTSTTNESGDYMLPLLISGTYNVTVEMTGFKKSIEKDVVVRVADKITINISLQLGEASESVQVVGAAPLVEAASASMGQVVDRRRLGELPLKDGNPIMLASLAPGVMNLSTGGWSRPFDNGSPSSITVDGARTSTSEFTVDGAPNTQRGNVAYIPPTEAVQEFKIQTATFDASMGYTPAAVINVSLKSGTNELHGSAYDFLQNTALNANNFFNNRIGLPRTQAKLIRWGTSAGGPLWLGKLYDGRNKLFWFYTYEGIHDAAIETAYSGAVPTPKERQGDFSDLLKIGSQYQIYDPATTASAGNGRYSRQPLPGNIIPPSRMNSTGVKLMSFWDQPNQPGTIDGSNNWYTPGPIRDYFYTHVFRVDYNFGEKNRLFARGNVNRRGDTYNQWFNGAMGTLGGRRNRGFALDDVHIFGPGFLMNVRYSYTRYYEGHDPLTRSFDVTALGFSSNLAAAIERIDPLAMKFPSINVAGFQGMGTDGYDSRFNDTHDLTAVFTRILRSHTLRFGTEYRIYRENLYSPGQASGYFSFASDFTNGPLDNSPAAPMGQGLASLLLGLPSSSSYLPVNNSYAEQSGFWPAYVQDDWKLSAKLTINLGLRYELEIPSTERFNRTVLGFDSATPSPIQATAKANYAANPIPQVPADQFSVLGGLTFAGVNGQPRSLWQIEKHKFAPRVGFAYSLNARTVLRGGYGMFYDQLGIQRRHVNQLGFSTNTYFVPSVDNGQHFIANLSDPFPNGLILPAGPALGLMTAAGQGISAFNTQLTTPYMHRWQISIQRELPYQAVIELAYVGNRGQNLITTRQLDTIPAKYLSTSPVRDTATINLLSAQVSNPFYPLLPGTSLSGTTVARSQLLLPYPQFTGVSLETNEGHSWYNAVQTRFEKRMSAGFTVNAAWTWSKFLEATSFLNPTDAAPAWVISDQDRTHRLVVSGVWELPLGQGRKWASGVHGFMGKLIGGWQAQAIYQRQSGPPLGFGNAILTGNLHDIPLASGQRTIDRWFNTSLFVTASSQQLASNLIILSPRFSGMRADGLNNWDISAVKNTGITERLRLQFRSEFINALNHAQFSVPNTTPSSTSFGKVTTTSQWPRTIQFALKLLF